MIFPRDVFGAFSVSKRGSIFLNLKNTLKNDKTMPLKIVKI